MTALPVNNCGDVDGLGGPAPLLLTSRYRRGDVVIEVSGEIDLDTAPLLERAFAEAREDTPVEGGHRDVVVDLGGVEFIDSTAMLALVNAREALEVQGRSLTLVPSPTVSRTLRLAGLISMFAISDALPDEPPRPGPGWA